MSSCSTCRRSSRRSTRRQVFAGWAFVWTCLINRANPSRRHHRKILGFFSSDRPGVLYKEQIITAVDAIIELIESPYNLGLILGALQSGKTTTALALQLAGPAIYLVTGLRVFPFYLTTNQNSHQEQLRNELAHFIKYYGGIDVVFAVCVAL